MKFNWILQEIACMNDAIIVLKFTCSSFRATCGNVINRTKILVKLLKQPLINVMVLWWKRFYLIYIEICSFQKWCIAQNIFHGIRQNGLHLSQLGIDFIYRYSAKCFFFLVYSLFVNRKMIRINCADKQWDCLFSLVLTNDS